MDPRGSQIYHTNDNDVSTTSTIPSSIPINLLGADEDVLIPKPADINRIFHQGRETWTRFLKSAESLPPNSFPAGLGDPSIMLKDIPALPKNLTKTGTVVGQPLWHIPDPEHQEDAQNNGWNLQYIHGPQKHLCLSFSKLIECHMSLQPDFSHFGELQRRKVVYSRHFLQPKIAKTCRAQPGDVVLSLGASVSRTLIRWLCAILAPKPGWSAIGGDFPPWAAFCSDDARFVISTDKIISYSSNESPPSSAQATEFLIELCSLYGLGPEKCKDRKSELLPPATAAFYAALALPFYRHVNLQPQFLVPTLRSQPIDRAILEPIRRYSIFWQPDIECNVVSSWLSSILSVIKPIINSKNLVMLAKVFAFRRPRVALWWLSIFLLGNPTVLDWIARYLETLGERWGFASMAPPDAAVAAWTGSPQSFLDEQSVHAYPELLDLVSRADLLRHRYNFRLQDTSPALSWRPFGYVAKDTVELELWPWLERRHIREYMHWVWWIKDGRNIVRDVQLGFRRDTVRFVIDVPDSLELDFVDQLTGRDNGIKLAPTRESTLRMIHYCMEDISGDRDTDISTMYGAKVHPWLKYWRGLE
ncbi:hypothetical protein F5X99DRAFT_407744 [Biscogniauxia marginata]|nr:hypothetical protein F5X99DRAFT_407744 [Biscogniauxia marginata]